MGHRSILVVDDDLDIRESLADALGEEGFAVATVRNGREALSWLEGNPPPCLILLDLMMPVMNGEQFRRAQLADAERSSIPVVLMSASPDASRNARALGTRGFLAKPLRLERLIETIDRHC